MNELQSLRARIEALIASIDATLNTCVQTGCKISYTDMIEATRLQTALDVLEEYAPVEDAAARVLTTAEMFGL